MEVALQKLNSPKRLYPYGANPVKGLKAGEELVQETVSYPNKVTEND